MNCNSHQVISLRLRLLRATVYFCRVSISYRPMDADVRISSRRMDGRRQPSVYFCNGICWHSEERISLYLGWCKVKALIGFGRHPQASILAWWNTLVELQTFGLDYILCPSLNVFLKHTNRNLSNICFNSIYYQTTVTKPKEFPDLWSTQIIVTYCE